MFVPLIHILTILSLPINTAFATPRFSPNRHNGLTVKRSQNTKTHAEGAGTVRYYDLLRTMTVRLRGGNAPYNGDRLFFPPVGRKLVYVSMTIRRPTDSRTNSWRGRYRRLSFPNWHYPTATRRDHDRDALHSREPNRQHLYG